MRRWCFALGISLLFHGLVLAPGLPAVVTPVASQWRVTLAPPRLGPMPGIPHSEHRVLSAAHGDEDAPASVAGRSGTTQASHPPVPRESRSKGAEPGEEVDGEGLRRYRLALAIQARGGRFSDHEAVMADRSGTAIIGIGVGVGGAVSPPWLEQSSGHRELDAAALALIEGAVARTPVPVVLQGKRFVLTLPVVFGLR
ncbi:MAG: hypothetical protein JSR19_04350 [Proteobacteria bacterium]|nr:hypothetical protein [Pseudomonadota bacterium]HQR05095.1 hypothetical protein [Rhodocyclaceae bacterium]